ncbi:MAG: hypothetical protein V4636_19985 [Pseudomonadota bacterium]
MKRFTLGLLAALALCCSQAPVYAGDAPIPPVRIRIFCTAPNQFEAQACWVEFGNPGGGRTIEVASQSEAEEMVAILLEYSSRRYAYDPLGSPREPPTSETGEPQ